MEQSEEFFDVCDENGIPTGEVVSRSAAHRDGIRHRTAHIWVVREMEDGAEVLLQKRSDDKDSFPGCWDTSSAGHIRAGDEPLPSAIRELEEELGIRAKPEDLPFVGTFLISFDREFHGAMFRDREIAFVYIYRKDVEIRSLKLQKEEVSEVRWFGIEDVLSAVERHDPAFCVPREGLQMVEKALKKY